VVQIEVAGGEGDQYDSGTKKITNPGRRTTGVISVFKRLKDTRYITREISEIF